MSDLSRPIEQPVHVTINRVPIARLVDSVTIILIHGGQVAATSEINNQIHIKAMALLR